MSLLFTFSKLCLNAVALRGVHSSPILSIATSPVLMAEPLKKKKKLDPQIVKQREERRKKKIEKQIRRLEKNARQLKPIDELETPFVLIDERVKRTRANPPHDEQVLEGRALLQKAWGKYRMNEKLADYQLVDQVVMAQEKALAELRLESEELYEAAIQPDKQLVTFTVKGPVHTPPLASYESPDGEYIDISKKWDKI